MGMPLACLLVLVHSHLLLYPHVPCFHFICNCTSHVEAGISCTLAHRV